MLATWPGVGNVAMIVAAYLQKKLAFKPLGEIEASSFFNPIGVLARDSVIEEPQFPQSKFFYWKGNGEGNDLILFTGDDQPNSKAYELAKCVLDVGLSFQVKRLYTCAAALTRINYTDQPRVWGVATNQQTAGELRTQGLGQSSTVQIAGLNGLILGAAREKDVPGICLLGEAPSHTPRIENPMAALAVLRVLARMLGIEIDLTELANVTRETKEQLRQVTAMAMGEYIEHFTEPIWEQDGGEDGDEDEE